MKKSYGKVEKTGDSGRPGDCDPNQLAALRQFVLRIAAMPEVEDCVDGDPGVCGLDLHGLPPDNVLLRYLRARKFDVDAAFEMFTTCLQWRADSVVLDEGLTVSANNALQKFDMSKDKLNKASALWEFGYHHTDRNGRPLYIDRIGKCDVDAMLEVITIEEFLDWHIYQWEECLNEYFPACSIETQSCIEQNCSIVDLDGLKTSYLFNDKFKEVFKRMSKMDSDNYPETMGKFFIINAGWTFRSAWGLLKGFLDPKTAAKITVLGGDYKDELLKHIEPCHLPKFLKGGTCECKDGCLIAKPGPWQGGEFDSPKREGKRDSRERLGDVVREAAKSTDKKIVGDKEFREINKQKPAAPADPNEEFHDPEMDEPENFDELAREAELEEAARGEQAPEDEEEEELAELGSPTAARPPPPTSCWSCCGSKDKEIEKVPRKKAGS